MNLKEIVVKYAKMCFDNGLTTGTSGNVSIRVGDVMYITPSALPYNEMQESDVLKVDIKTGEKLEGKRNPSSETPMHSHIYLKSNEIKAIVHTFNLCNDVCLCT